jgi:hypothetical protein
MIYEKEIRKAVEIALRVTADASDERFVLPRSEVEAFVRIVQLEVLEIFYREMKGLLDRLKQPCD